MSSKEALKTYNIRLKRELGQVKKRHEDVLKQNRVLTYNNDHLKNRISQLEKEKSILKQKMYKLKKWWQIIITINE